MATEYVVEILGWDQALHLFPNPGGIPEEHTFQGELIFLQHLEIEGRVRSPPRHKDKRVRAWVSRLWPPDTEPACPADIGTIEERSDGAGRELLAQLYIPESALAPATFCLGSSWKFLRITTDGRIRGRPRIVGFSFSRSRSDAV